MNTFAAYRRFAVFALVLLLALAAPSAMASHLRGGSVSWRFISSTPTTYTVEFTFQHSQRWSYPYGPGTCPGAAAPACPALNSSVNLSQWSGAAFNFGDNSTQFSPTGTVTSVNQAEDWATATFKFQHTYSTSQSSYTAYFFDNARISTLKLGHDQNEYISATVRNYSNGSPVASVPAILAVPLQSTASFSLASAVTDIDPDVTVQYRLSSFAEIFGPPAISALTAAPCPSGGNYLPSGLPSGNPPGFTISSDGVVTWDETRIATALSSTGANCGFGTPKAGDLWTAQAMAMAVNNTTHQVVSQVPIDLLLKFINPVGALPTLSVTPSGTQTVSVGTAVTFTVTGNSSNTGAKVTLNASGVPQGATATNLNAALTPPAVSTFTWTPTAAQYGTYVVTFTATDNNLQQITASESIVVASLPSATCGPAQSVAYGTPATVSATVFDQNNEALNLAWSVEGAQVHRDSGILAYPTSQTVSYSQDFGVTGDHQVSVVATDPHGVTATCNTKVTVAPADQTISFAPLPDATYGAPDFNVAASASSNLLVEFAAAGNCALVNGNTLHVTGAGQCTVTASQPGDQNHNAALAVSQSFTIAKAVAAVTPNAASKIYGQNDPALTGALTGFLPSDNVSATYTRAAGESVLGGPYAISATVSPASELANYTVTYNTAQLTITPASLTVTANSTSRVYGGADPEFTGIITGIVNSDAITATYSANATTASPVGSYAIVPTLSGAALSNYTVIAGNGSLTITAAPLTVTANNATRSYGAADPAFTGIISGIVNNDGITATYAAGSTAASPVGAYTIVPTLSGAALSNYAVNLSNGTLTITPAALTITANNATRNYGAANPAFTGTIAGVLNNDAITATYSSAANTQSGIGTYPIVPALSGTALSNYAVTSNNGTLTVMAIPLVVTPADATRAYGAANPALNGTVSGVQDADPITITYLTAANTTSDPGSYAISAHLNDPQNKLGNYSVTLNTGTLTITKANQGINWTTPAAINYGTALSAAQLYAAISVSGPAAAGAATYSPAAGTILGGGVQTLTVNVAETIDYNPASATVQLTVNRAQPVFSGLKDTSLVYHSGSVTLNGALTAPAAIPAGQQVAITLNNVTQSAVVASNGSFATTFNTAALPVSANGYTVSYSFAGSDDFAPASATRKLTVAYAVCDLYNTAQAKQSGSTYPITVAVCDANNQNVSMPGMVLTAVAWGGTSPAFSPVPDAGNSNGNGIFRNTGGAFMWNLKTTGMSAGDYNLFFTISGDPTLHFAPFAVR